MRQVSASELATLLCSPAAGDQAPVVLDVREPWEVALAPFERAIHIPMNEIPYRAEELEADRPTAVICHHGVRSFQVGVFLERLGFSDVMNVAGGIDGWAREVDPRLPRY